MVKREKRCWTVTSSINMNLLKSQLFNKRLKVWSDVALTTLSDKLFQQSVRRQAKECWRALILHNCLSSLKLCPRVVLDFHANTYQQQATYNMITCWQSVSGDCCRQDWMALTGCNNLVLSLAPLSVSASTAVTQLPQPAPASRQEDLWTRQSQSERFRLNFTANG